MKHVLHLRNGVRIYTPSLFVALALALLFAPILAVAQGQSPAVAAEHIRTQLLTAQLALTDDVAQAQVALHDAEATYATAIAPVVITTAPETTARAIVGGSWFHKCVSRGL